jgi:L-threonylcarbamoyladenylate synthase
MNDLPTLHYSTRVLSLGDSAAQDSVAQNEVLTLLAQEQIFAAPTDTVFGLFCRPDSVTAIERLYVAKARPPDKAIPILIGEQAQLAQVALPPWSAAATCLMERLWPGALTLVLPAQSHLPSILTAGQPTVAVRMPDHALLCALLRKTGPLAATSANRSGGPDTHSVAEVLAQLDGRIPLLLRDETCDDRSPPSTTPPSTIVDLSDPLHPRLLRQGPLGTAVQAILAELRGEGDRTHADQAHVDRD